MTDSRSALIEVVRVVAIERRSVFSWFGAWSEAQNGQLTPRTRREYLQTRLQQRLYRNFYSTGKPVPIVENDEREEVDEEAFVEALSASNCGRGAEERGWRAVRDDGATVLVAKDGLTFRVGADAILRRRTKLSFCGLKELRGISPGFYTVLGDTALPLSKSLLRVYWNVSPDGAASFVRHTSRILNNAAIAFRAKVVSNPLCFDRCDSGVVYLLRRDYQRAHPLLRRLYSCLKRELRYSVPALTKQIGRGVAVAEDPRGDKSFGEDRCHVLADALIRAHEKRTAAPEARVSEILRAFKRNGIAPSKPFLNVGSADVYDFLER